jgi:hypothetical protein
MRELLMFFHLVGIIIGLGAVIVIDTMGFFSRKNKKKTQQTIYAHYTTKPLIWLGTIIVSITWIFILIYKGFTLVNEIKTILLVIMILNGCFLSFVISPALDKLKASQVILPSKLQLKISISLVVSFITWWSFVAFTFAELI